MRLPKQLSNLNQTKRFQQSQPHFSLKPNKIRRAIRPNPLTFQSHQMPRSQQTLQSLSPPPQRSQSSHPPSKRTKLLSQTPHRPSSSLLPKTKARLKANGPLTGALQIANHQEPTPSQAAAKSPTKALLHPRSTTPNQASRIPLILQAQLTGKRRPIGTRKSGRERRLRRSARRRKRGLRLRLERS